MDKGKWTTAAVLGVGLGILATPASAAPPLGADARGLKATLAQTSLVEQARWVRRCWRDWRGRHCRRVWVGPRFGWAPYYGPGLNLYFGGPRRHWRDHRSFRGPRFGGPPRGPHFGPPRAFRPQHFGGGPQFRGGGRHR